MTFQPNCEESNITVFYLVIFSGLVFTLQKEQKMENIYLALKEIYAMNILYIYAFKKNPELRDRGGGGEEGSWIAQGSPICAPLTSCR